MSSLNGINKKDYYLRQEIDKVDQFVDDSKVYGVFADFDNNIFTRLGDAVGKTRGADFDDIGPWRRRRCNLTDDGVVLAYVGDENYTEYGKTLVEIKKDGRIFPIGTNVQVMVEQPKFYYKVEPLDLGWVDIRETWGIYSWTASIKVETEQEMIIRLGSTNISIMVPAKTTQSQLRALLLNKQHEFDTIGWQVMQTADLGWFINFENITGNNTPDDFVFRIFYNGEEYPVLKVANRELKKCVANKINYYISPTQRTGYKLHPAFKKGGKEVSHVYLSSYWSSCQNTDGEYSKNGETVGSRLSSVSDVMPVTGLIQLTCRRKANERGVGWNLGCMESISLTQLLFIIEYCSFNMQNMIGNGLYISIAPYKIENGQTSYLKNSSGESNAIDTGSLGYNKKITYRGEEEFFGSLGYITDCNLLRNSAYLSTVYIGDAPSHNTSDEIPSNYKKLDFFFYFSNSYTKKFGYSKEFDWLFLSCYSKINGNGNLPIGDLVGATGASASLNAQYKAVFCNGFRANSTINGAFASNSPIDQNSGSIDRTARLFYIPQEGEPI